MKRLWMWFWLLNKRLYRKVTFLGLVLLIPVLVLSFYSAAGESGGIVTIALAQEDTADATADALIAELMSDSRVIQFQKTTPQEALELVQTGKADCAWIFPENTASHIAGFAMGEETGFIRVIEREQSVTLRLAREKLSGVLYSPVAKSLYLQHLREYIPETVSDEQLLSYLEKTHVNGDLFAFYDVNGNLRESSGSFLTAPLRGLLAVLTLVCAVVTAMYYQKDQDAGRFSLLPERYLALTELAYQAVSAVNMMLVILISLLCTGMYHKLWQELTLFLLYGLCCCLFGMLLRRILNNLMPAILPGLIAIMLVIPPVFFDLAGLRPVQLLLPPTYFIQGGYNPHYLLYLAIYDAFLAGLILVWNLIGRFKIRKS